MPGGFFPPPISERIATSSSVDRSSTPVSTAVFRISRILIGTCFEIVLSKLWIVALPWKRAVIRWWTVFRAQRPPIRT